MNVIPVRSLQFGSGNIGNLLVGSVANPARRVG